MTDKMLVDQVRRLYCYLHYHPKDGNKKASFDKFSRMAWDRNLSVNHILYGIPVTINSMTDYEIQFYLDGVIDIIKSSWYKYYNEQ